jgi:hypothetical protein
MFGRPRQVGRATIVENKRLETVLAYVAGLKKQRDMAGSKKVSDCT